MSNNGIPLSKNITDNFFKTTASKITRTLHIVTPETLNSWQKNPQYQSWIEANNFQAKPTQVLLLPQSMDVLIGDPAQNLDAWGAIAINLPVGHYKLADTLSPQTLEKVFIGWALGQYHFDRYRALKHQEYRTLVWEEAVDKVKVQASIEATFLVRDMITTPAQDMGPGQIEDIAGELAKAYGADIEVTKGKKLIANNFPMIHAVGRASKRAPRLIDIKWRGPGQKDLPKVTLVGKGVCFDAGGLDLKPSSGMLHMKKDMGGSAHVLGLALMIMKLKLPVQLRVLVPAVENLVSSSSYKPMDILTSRQGTTVEVGNTDAEGRLILADALSYACEENPDILIDMATLTGAARVAVGIEMAAFFSTDEILAQKLQEASIQTQDPVWHMPLHEPYRRYLQCPHADISSTGSSRYAGSITAALFLQTFITKGTPWLHLDMNGYNMAGRPGHPVGGDAQGMRAVFHVLEQKFL